MTGTKVGVPVRLGAPVVALSKPFRTPMTIIPGVPAADALDANDALGTAFFFDVPVAGILQMVVVADLDKEQLQIDFVFLNRPFTDTVANDAAYDLNDDDGAADVFVVSVTTFYAFNDNAIGQATNLAIPFLAPLGRLYCRAVTRGAPNLTAATDYRVSLVGLE